MRNWYGPDETREPWCFLTLLPEGDTQEPTLASWGLGVGNPERLLSTETQLLQSDREETDLIVGLGEVLDTRRYTGMVLITPEELTLARLRRRLTACSALHSPTFRGFSHIALDTVLERYFDISTVSEFNEQYDHPIRTETGVAPTTGDDPADAVEQLWRAWTAIYRLIPTTACLGEPL
jgi:hypothetical protein